MIQRHIKYVYREGIYLLYEGKEGGEPVVNYVGGSPLCICGQTEGINPFTYGPPYDYSLNPSVYVNGAYLPSGGNGFDILPRFLGIAHHSRKVDSYVKKVAVIKRPAIITLFKGKAGMKEFQQAEEYYPFGFTEDDPIHPIYLETDETLNPGDFLIPWMITVGGVNYSVWAKPTTTRLNVSQGTVVFVPARVQAVSGTGDDLLVTIEVSHFTLKL